MNRVVRQITRAVADRHGVTVEQIAGRSRRYDIAHARGEAMYMVRQHNPDIYTYPNIGRQFGRNHATVIWCINSHIARTRKPQPH